MSHKINNRQWSGRFGFIMAVVGSAVGLGNIWRFPYQTGQSGGAIFLIVYIIMVATLGFILSSAEIAFGRNAQSNVIHAYSKKNKKWSFGGILCIIISFMIISYYSVIGGWLLKYLGGYIGGGSFVSNGDYSGIFNSFINSSVEPILLTVLFLAFCAAVLALGVKKGIENVSKILMPALFFMLIFVAIVGLTMDGAIEGIKFFLIPDFDRISESGGIMGIIVAAMGQAFFSLNIGIGINATYGSYLKKDINIPKNTVTICAFDTLVAILAGFAILPAVFATPGVEPSAGPSLIFQALPAVFANLGNFGIFVAIIFFVLVFFAALTSAISIIEVIISFVEEKFKLKRYLATILTVAVVSLTSILVSLSVGGYLGGIDLFNIFDLATTNILLPLSAIILCMYIVFVWKTANAKEELLFGLDNSKHSLMSKIWEIGVKYVAPIMVFIVFIFGVLSMFGITL